MRAEFGTASRQLRVGLSSLNFEGLSVLNLQTPSLQSHNPRSQAGVLLAILAHDRRLRSKTTQKENTMTQTSATQRSGEQAADKNAIRPFHVNIPEAELAELRRRINATKWPERETLTDASQGVQLATIQTLARYWASEYDWRKIQSKM